MTIKISEVQINLIKPNAGIVGFASLVVNDSIYLSSIAIHKKIEGSEYRITYPTKKLSIDNSINLFHPINRQASFEIEQAIFTKLKEVMNKGKHDRYSSDDFGNG